MLAVFCVLVSAARLLAAGQVMTGEPRRVPADSAAVLTAARFAAAEFSRANTGDRSAYQIANITSAEIQVESRTRRGQRRVEP